MNSPVTRRNPRPFAGDIGWALGLFALLALLALGIGYAVGQSMKPETGAIASIPGAGAPQDGAPALSPAAAGTDPAGTGALPGWTEVYVNDYADLLGPEAEATLRDQVRDVWRETGVELTILTLPTMRAYGHDGPIEPFATRLFNAWGIGDARRNDGVLILVARQDRMMRIELGAGYAPLWDQRMKQVIDEAFLPAFRRDDYEGGIMEGAAETIRALTGRRPGEAERPDGPVWLQGWQAMGARAQDHVAHLAIFGAASALLAAAALRLRMRNRPRRCLDCGLSMARLSEQADDAHLDGGQKLEEYLSAVDYDVWACPDEACGHLRIERWRNWFSPRRTCRSCGYRTMETNSHVIKPATTSSTGMKRLDYFCPHCDYRNSELRTIPRKSKSSGGGGGGFGGGSSSGGGASGGW